MSLNPEQLQERESARLQWARQALGDDEAMLRRASVDAGHRSYWRSSGRGHDHMVMDSPPGLEDVRPWLQMRDLLEQGGVRLPRVLARDVDAGFLLLEDLGGPTLGQVLDESNADAYFEAAITQLLRLQAIAVPHGMGDFGEALLQRDAGLFEEWFLRRHLGIDLDCDESDKLEIVQRRLMDNALGQHKVLTHRDFMPRNLMPAQPDPAVLDFQDCVRGPIAYDPVSLFKDAFLSWPLARVDTWLVQFQRDADWMGVQRHLKILGIFSRLHYRDGKSKYLDDVPRFITYLEEVLPRHQSLQPLAELLEDRIKPALAKRSAA